MRWNELAAVLVLCGAMGGSAFAQAGGDRMPPDKMAPGTSQGTTAQATMGEMHEHKAGVASTTLAVTVGGKTTTLTVAELQTMPQRTVTVHNAHLKVDETYSGVAVSDLLAKQGVTAEGAGARRVYRSYLKVEGTDGYWVLYSASEREGAVHKGEVIVALTVDGKTLGEDGKFKLVSTEEQKPARWVRNLMGLTLVAVE